MSYLLKVCVYMKNNTLVSGYLLISETLFNAVSKHEQYSCKQT